ncbi:MAG: bifunctional [glutamate--ammonia ligase]-adenylyl-L-tyrosine phosphorylase/[glutamate--ammonia-ligase] adenylyltransferase [Pseudoxanthomonas sp.]
MAPHETDLDALIARNLDRLPAEAVAALDQGARAKLRRLASASDFAIETLRRQPALLHRFVEDAATPLPPPPLRPDNAAEWPALLRRHRCAESVRLVWRDVVDDADVDEILAGSTHLAEQCLRLALAALEADFAQRHGTVRDANGQAQRLVVFGLGKLGGGELNFSSDIDLVYAYPQEGESDGARPLAAEDYFARLGQRLAKLLDETTADGFSHRVDLRLRPFGSAGRVALSFAALDHYFQHEGRDWERYAWLKARAVAGDVDAGERWLRTLRPFVYRRYLDFTALDGLREMKAMIAAEVARRELADDIKRGPGGIREIEFLAQALQLIHGGRDASLRERRLLPALRALAAARLVAEEDCAALIDAYRFLRKLENRLQMLRDAQTHALPENAPDRARIAATLDYPDWDALLAALQRQRARVAGEFAELLAPRRGETRPGALQDYWRALPEGGDAGALATAGFAGDADAALRDFSRASGVLGLSPAARARLDRVLPALLEAAAQSAQPDAALRRLLQLLHAILRRASYLALLDEQPAALARLVDVIARSAFLADRLIAYPLLLDELLDARIAGPLPDRAQMRAACTAALHESEPGNPDAEQSLRQLNETRLALSFRIALAALDRRQSANDSARQLAWLAEEVVRAVLDMAVAAISTAHGRIVGGRFAVVGYGSLGAEELGFGSDLDLVFLYDAPDDAQSEPAPAQAGGARPLDAPRWYMRLTQKLVALLGAMTAAGRLYDVDARLRPDGGKSVLVTSLASYREYQRDRAWTWEHQALVRARGIAGDASLLGDFDSVRTQTLTQPRDAEKLRTDVVEMRRKMRAALDRSDAGRFDLKQGAGGLVDIEFLLQYLVLRESAAHPRLQSLRNTPELVDALHAENLLDAASRDALAQAHVRFLADGLACTLDRRKRIVAETAEITALRESVRGVLLRHGLDFDGEGIPA